MGDIAIRVSGLGKQYRIGARRKSYSTLRDTLADAAAGVARSLRGNGARPTDETIWALKDVSFEVKRGEVLGIIGRNGAGKSTLLKILSRITEPTCGEVDVYGRVGSLLEVGTGFHPELTGRENIYLNGAVLGMHRREIQRKFDEIVDFSGIEKFIDTPVKHYSSGMYMRLAFAVAAHLEPEILLVDEVLAVGDAEFQKKCLGKMGEVARGGRTVLFVSHNMNAIEEICRRVLILNNGLLRRDGVDVRAAINENLFVSPTEDVLKCEWNNSGSDFSNSSFMPLKFALCDESGQVISQPVNNNCSPWLIIEANIDKLDPALTVGYAIYHESGVLLYWSYQTDQAEHDWPKLASGHNTLRSRIPPRLLNEGQYRIELIGGLHFRQWLFEPGSKVPAIRLEVRGGLSDSPFWIAARPGAIAPVLPWRGD